MHRAHNGACLRNGCRRDRPGNAKVRYFDPPITANQNIMRFNIPVNDLVMMSVSQRIANLGSNPHSFFHPRGARSL